jgi:hypothetical protein
MTVVRRFGRILLNVVTLASLALCVVTVLAWARSGMRPPALLRPLGPWHLGVESNRLVIVTVGRSEGDPGQSLEIRAVPEVDSGGRRGIAWEVTIVFGYGERRQGPSRFHTMEGHGGACREGERGGPTPPTFTYSGRSIGIGWIVTVLGVAPALRLGGRLRRSRRVAGRCPACGYDLRATPDRCPECGAIPTPP